MILIFTGIADASSNLVIDYLHYKHGKKTKRMFLLNEAKISFGIGNHGIDIKLDDEPVTAAWFYKGFHLHSELVNSCEKKLDRFFKDEIEEFRKNVLFLSSNSTIPILGKNPFEYIDISKVRALIEAQKVGLNIPDTLYTFSKAALRAFKKKHEVIISKPLSNIIFLDSKDGAHTFSMHTKKIASVELNEDGPDFIFPSILQEYIEANVELRIFFLKKKLFAGAIFNKKNTGESCDYRSNKGNRMVPFNLPEDLKYKLNSLTRNLGLNSGSIDMLITKGGEYFLLEINAVGQFGFVSKQCNYTIEEHIADYLADPLNYEEAH